MTIVPPFGRTLWCAMSCLALTPAVGGAQTLPMANISTDPVDTLSMHLRTLSIAPRSLSALLGAGEAALAVGDINAALGFFARAEEVDGRSGRAKAGLGAALVMLERPNDALPLFGQAISLGLPEAEVARDRGLAYDLRGDSKQAQRDYAMALRSRPDDETTRRYALSLGISGERAQAMAMLDPLLRKKDQSAWRARAFILAMNGDVSGANSIARQVMPEGLAATMSPFLARLATLNAADRAHAVNFGTMPSNGATYAAVEIGDPFRAAGGAVGGGSVDGGLIPAGEPLGRRKVAPVSRETGRRDRAPSVAAVPPASERPTAAPSAFGVPLAVAKPPVSTSQRIGTRVGTRIAMVDRAALPPEARGEATAKLMTGQTVLPPPSGALGTVLPPVAMVQGPPVAAFETSRAEPTVAAVVPALAAKRVARLASILDGIQPEPESAPIALPTAAEVRAAKRLAQRKAAETAAAAAVEKAAKDAKTAELELARRNPVRLWVQVATGNNTKGLPSTWVRIRDGNATALKGKTAFSVPFKATNRLLVGPMKSPADARALVNTLAKGGVSATTFSSEAGQEVDRIAAK